MHETYRTPEGFELARPLLLPDARDFADVLTYVCEWADLPAPSARRGRYGIGGPCALGRDWCSLGMRLHNGTECIGRGGRHEGSRTAAVVDGNHLGPYCTVDAGGVRHRGIAVIPTSATRDALTGQLVTPDDHLSFRVIEHEANGRALIIAQHGYIIGSRYLAYVDPATIPARTAVDW